MSIANLVSFIRLFSTIIIVFWINQYRFFDAFILFSLAALSDLLDGFLARMFKSRSKFGAYLDPIADKVLLVSVFIALSCHGKIPMWLTFLVIGRDLLILGGVLSLHLAQKRFLASPLFVSKVNTALQMVLVLICLYDPSNNNFIYPIALYGTALTTLLSGFFYVQIWKKMMELDKISS